MHNRHYQALRDGHMPSDVAPDSALGRQYAAILKAGDKAIAASEDHPLSDRQLARIVELLRA